LAQYDHTEGDRSITGGFVYRGRRIPSLVGHYVFGDWVSGRLFNLDPNTLEIQEITIDPAGDPGGKYIGFGETPTGELLIVTADFNSSPPSRLLEVVSGLAPGLDSDADGVDDDFDNCKFVPNGPDALDAGQHSQLDTDNDGYGNLCDPDLNNDGLVTVTDFLILRGRLNSQDDDADLNGDGLVTVTDFLILRSRLNQPPGPSATAP